MNNPSRFERGDFPECVFERNSEFFPERGTLREKLLSILKDISSGMHNDLADAPQLWSGYSYKGAPSVKVIGTLLNYHDEDFIVAHIQIGIAKELGKVGLWQDRKGMALKVDSGPVEISTSTKIGKSIVYYSPPKVLKSGERYANLYPFMEERIHARGVEREATCTAVSTRQMAVQHWPEADGLTQLSLNDKRELIESFSFFNGSIAY